MTQLTLLTRMGCHLCDVMKSVVARASERRPLELREVDVSTNRELEQRFGHEIPVLLSGETVIARYRVSVTELLERLADPSKENR